MSLSHFRHPFDIARHPTPEREVKRAILASWASDATAPEGRPVWRRPARTKHDVATDNVIDALGRSTAEARKEA